MVTPVRLAAIVLVLAGSATLLILAGTSTPSLALPAYVAAGRTASAPPATTPPSTTTTVPATQAVTQGTTTYITPIRAVHIEDDRGGALESPGDRSKGQADVSPGHQPGD